MGRYPFGGRGTSGPPCLPLVPENPFYPSGPDTSGKSKPVHSWPLLRELSSSPAEPRRRATARGESGRVSYLHDGQRPRLLLNKGGPNSACSGRTHLLGKEGTRAGRRTRATRRCGRGFGGRLDSFPPNLTSDASLPLALHALKARRPASARSRPSPDVSSITSADEQTGRGPPEGRRPASTLRPAAWARPPLRCS